MRWRVVHEFPERALEEAWRASLREADFPAHYVAPEFFREPFWTGRHPFAVVAMEADDVVGVVTGIRDGSHLVAGLSVRPQVCCRTTSDSAMVARTLAAGLRAEARGKAGLVSVYTWAGMDGFLAAGFRGRRYAGDEGLVILDLTRGPDALFRDFSENRRTNIRKAMKSGLEVSQTTDPEEWRAFYAMYADWCSAQADRGPAPLGHGGGTSPDAEPTALRGPSSRPDHRGRDAAPGAGRDHGVRGQLLDRGVSTAEAERLAALEDHGVGGPGRVPPLQSGRCSPLPAQVRRSARPHLRVPPRSDLRATPSPTGGGRPLEAPRVRGPAGRSTRGRTAGLRPGRIGSGLADCRGEPPRLSVTGQERLEHSAEGGGSEFGFCMDGNTPDARVPMIARAGGCQRAQARLELHATSSVQSTNVQHDADCSFGNACFENKCTCRGWVNDPPLPGVRRSLDQGARLGTLLGERVGDRHEAPERLADRPDVGARIGAVGEAAPL